MVYLAKTRQAPRQVTPERVADRGVAAPVVSTDHPVDQPAELPPSIELMKLEAEVFILKVKLEAAQAGTEGLRQQLRNTELLVADTRQERDDWRDRHDAREAELRVLRGEKGLPWWRKLIGVQPVHELPDSMIEVQ
jgi:hypothetical protein